MHGSKSSRILLDMEPGLISRLFNAAVVGVERQGCSLQKRGGVSTLTSRIFLKLEGIPADHATTPELGGFHAQLRALDERNLADIEF